jgi:hypothetical protein
LSSPTTPLSPIVHNLSLSPTSSIPQSILERLSPGNVFSSQQSQQPGRRRSKNSLSGTIKQGKNHRNLPLADLWSLAENSSGGAVLLKAQLLEAAKKMHQKEVKFKKTKNDFNLTINDCSLFRSLKIAQIVVLFCKTVHLYYRIRMRI